MGVCSYSAGPNVSGYGFCYSYPSSDAVVAEALPSETTPQIGGGAISTPGVTSPTVPSFESPLIGTPATCTLAECNAPWSVGPVATPPIPKTCDPTDFICVGPGASIPILPNTPMPALCSAASMACVPSQTVLPEGAAQTPAVPSMTILGSSSVPVPVLLGPAQTPGIGLYVNRTITSTDPPQVGFATVGPFIVDGPLPVTICASTCSVPYIYGNGQVSVEASVGGQTYGYTLTE